MGTGCGFPGAPPSSALPNSSFWAQEDEGQELLKPTLAKAAEASPSGNSSQETGTGRGFREARLSGLGGCAPSPLEAAQDEGHQGHQGDAHGGGGHQQPDDRQRVCGVVLGHELALKGEAERQQQEPPWAEPSEGVSPRRLWPSAWFCGSPARVPGRRALPSTLSSTCFTRDLQRRCLEGPVESEHRDSQPPDVWGTRQGTWRSGAALSPARPRRASWFTLSNTRHGPLLGTCPAARETEELNFKFYLILTNLNSSFGHQLLYGTASCGFERSLVSRALAGAMGVLPQT